MNHPAGGEYNKPYLYLLIHQGITPTFSYKQDAHFIMLEPLTLFLNGPRIIKLAGYYFQLLGKKKSRGASRSTGRHGSTFMDPVAVKNLACCFFVDYYSCSPRSWAKPRASLGVLAVHPLRILPSSSSGVFLVWVSTVVGL